jgi:tritrans,polycis-undecaprenyl-diphosphate synthase [geranylgeranyl-diphosphate specific]
MEKSENRVPKHIGIVMDGNRRFSKRLMMKPWKGHEWGAKKVEQLFEWCKELGIKELTLYTFSVQNFNRPKKEYDYLMDLFRKEFDKLKEDPKIYDNKIRINIIGRIWMFPKDVQERLKDIMERTKEHDNYIVNFAMAYGGREEVMDAVKKLAEQIKNGEVDIENINEESFARNLYMQDEPEMIIRTGGEKRTSNFLLWQSHYAEWFFLEKMWPEFEKEDLIECINEFCERERRFGK